MSDKALIERLRGAAAEEGVGFADSQLFAEAADTIARLTAERDAAREHAAMYLWLRERYPTLTTMQAARGLGLDLSRVYVNTAEKFDDAIRAAMREGEKLPPGFYNCTVTHNAQLGYVVREGEG